MTFLGDKQSIVKGLKDLNKNYVSDETFRQLYGSTALAEQQSLQTLDYDYAQAMSDAYATSMQSQTAIQGSNLGQGYKQQLMAQNQADITAAFEEYRNNYLSNQQSIVSQYDQARKSISDAYAEREKQLNVDAGYMQDYVDEYYKYAKWLHEHDYADFTESGLYQLVDEQGNLKPYQELLYVDDETKELSEDSKRALYTLSRYGNEDDGDRTRYSFSEYLAENNRDLGEWAVQNGQLNDKLFNEMFGLNEGAEKGWATGKTFGGAEGIIEQLKADKNSILKFDKTNIQANTDRYGMSREASVKELTNNEWRLGEEYSLDEFESNMESKILKDSDGKNKTQTAKNVLEDARNKNLKNGTIVDVDYGKGEMFYMWYNGKFVKLDKSYYSDNVVDSSKVDFDFNSLIVGDKKYASKDSYTLNELSANYDNILKHTSGVSGGKRDKVLSEFITMAKYGKITDGTVINVNYGKGKPVYISYTGNKFIVYY